MPVLKTEVTDSSRTERHNGRVIISLPQTDKRHLPQDSSEWFQRNRDTAIMVDNVRGPHLFVFVFALTCALISVVFLRGELKKTHQNVF